MTIRKFSREQIHGAQANASMALITELTKLDIVTTLLRTKFDICDVYDNGYCERHGGNVGGCATLTITLRVSP